MKKFLAVIVLFAAAYLGWTQFESVPDSAGNAGLTGSGDKVLALAFEQRKNDFQVEGSGVVIKVLPDDSDGSRHQRFILRLDSGQTLLISHNIDLAPRIPALRNGDAVSFYGEYEWNPNGGVVHWTHLDPSGRHVAGWLRHDGQIYQ